MQPRKVTWALTTDDADGICLSQTPGGAGNLTINGALASGGVATLTSANCTQRRVRLTAAGNETGRVFTVTGTRAAGEEGNASVIQEQLAGPNATTVDSRLDFATVTQISVDAATAGAITVGTNTIGSTPWVRGRLDMRAPFAIGFGCVVTGTVNYDVEHTFDPPIRSMTTYNEASIPDVFDHSSVVGKTASSDGNYAFPVTAYRLTINSGTGTVEFSYIQAGIIGN